MGLIDSILGRKPQADAARVASYFKTFTEYAPQFSTYDGGVYELGLTRSAIDRFATACSKLKPEIQGTAKPRIARAVTTSPNSWQSWPQFLYRLATIVECDTTGYVVAELAPDGETVTGIWPLKAERAEIVDYSGAPWVRFYFATGDTAAIELVVFPKALQQCGAYLTADSAVLLTGRIDAREEEAPKVLLNEAQPLNEGAVNALTTAEKPAASVFSDAEAAKRAPHQLWIRLDSLKGVKWPGIRAVLSTCPGDTPVYLYPLDTKKTTLVSRRLWCRPDENILQKLRFLLSEDDVIIK